MRARPWNVGHEERRAALSRDPLLVKAVEDAGALHDELIRTRGLCGKWCYADLLRMDEVALCARLHDGILNFYPSDGGDGRSKYAE